MRCPLALTLALSFLTTLSLALSPPREISISIWPLSAPKPSPLAQISYTPTNATLKSYSAPTVPSSEDIVRLGFTNSAGQWSGIATSASNFETDGKAEKVLQLHVRPDGEAYHLGLKIKEPVSQGKVKGKKVEGLGVEVVQIQKGPVPSLNKPVVVSADGDEAKEPEKSFLQKYWWALALFLLFQVVMGGAKE